MSLILARCNYDLGVYAGKIELLFLAISGVFYKTKTGKLCRRVGARPSSSLKRR